MMVRADFCKTVGAAGLTLGCLAISWGLPAIAQEQNAFPGRRVSGGTRGDCPIDPTSVVALSPDTNLSVTHDESPTVYFAVPEAAETYQVTFMLQDEQAMPVYEDTLTVGEQAELVGLQIPANSLNSGEYYQWYFIASCDEASLVPDIMLEGWIHQAVETPATADASSDIERARAYQTAGLWNDAIALTAELMQADPESATHRALWSQLLADVGLDTVIDESLIVRLPSSPR